MSPVWASNAAMVRTTQRVSELRHQLDRALPGGGGLTDQAPSLVGKAEVAEVRSIRKSNIPRLHSFRSDSFVTLTAARASNYFEAPLSHFGGCFPYRSSGNSRKVLCPIRGRIMRK